ncbi:Hypothetical protein NTJ_08275 [Nesidiocoris tenuis]|uniref:Uncharacterized protein n=1 Tax=Nesidiocoris tenuis TaxID=355587 RepID=A0ABN7ATD3_9HEMI|nr:Hypothetical protein NTJ_08275 [Nesidiocoris tenuis]
MTPQNSIYCVWPVALRQWDVFQKLTPSEQDDVRSFVVFWGGFSALYITSRDEVCGVGNNGVHVNLLGLASPHYRLETTDRPVEVRALSGKGIRQLSTGVYLAAAIDRDGWLYWWGACSDEIYGAIATPRLASEVPRYSHVSCGAMFMAALAADGWVYVWGRFWNTDKFYKERPLTTRNVAALSCGVNHVAMVGADEDGAVYTWGDGRHGQRGYLTYSWPSHDDTVQKVQSPLAAMAVHCGGHSTLFVTRDDGHVYACGANDARHGRLGVGAEFDVVSRPMRVLLPTSAGAVTELSSGWRSTLTSVYAALMSNGDVYTWGVTALPQLVSSAGGSLVSAAFLGEPTPRGVMLHVRSPSLVPPPAATSADQSSIDEPSKKKYVQTIINQLSCV